MFALHYHRSLITRGVACWRPSLGPALAACLIGGLTLATGRSSLAGEGAASDIREAFEKGGPLVSCWNVRQGWNLHQQVQWIREGHRYFPAIYCPLIEQGANKAAKWKAFYSEHRDELAFINREKLPVTLRWHNWLDGFYGGDPSRRPPLEKSPLVHRRREDGSLDSQKIVDPFAPLEPWSAEGKTIGASYWVHKLAEALPDCPRIYWLENNEASIGEAGAYTTPIDERDAWRYRKRQWRENLAAISVRAADYAKQHPDASALEGAINRLYREKYEAMEAAMLASAPPAWKGRIYFGGYGGLMPYAQRGMQGLKWSYERPEEDWQANPWAPAIWRYTEPSDRCYDDGSGSPWNWHDWVRGPHILQHNFGPLTRYLMETRPLWHEDRSFWISPQRCRRASEEHGGYVLPQRAKGFARACLWSDRPKGRATCLRWFAPSGVNLSDAWFAADKDPPEFRKLTHFDYFAPVVEVVDEVWDQPTLLRFWREGDPVLNPDPPLCDWVLPSAIGNHTIVDDRSRVLYTDADPPRFNGTKDTWRAADGKLELRVFAQAYRIGAGDQKETLVFAWSPRQVRENVNVKVPDIGDVLFDRVDQDGEWRVFPGDGKIE